MVPPGMQLTQPVQMSMPHELDTSYYGWPMPYQLPPQQPTVSAGPFSREVNRNIYNVVSQVSALPRRKF